jgi:polyisoprenoid-binding protein YceI
MSKWQIDSQHSSAKFSVQHLGVSWVSGQIFGVSGEIDFEPGQIEQAAINAKLDAATITTGNEQRDGHLKSPDFLDVENYKEVTFVSKSVKKLAEDKAILTGDLTIKDVAREVDLEVRFLEAGIKPGQDGSSQNVAGFLATAEINREDFGLKWNMDLSNGKVLVGNTVKIEIEVEALK